MRFPNIRLCIPLPALAAVHSRLGNFWRESRLRCCYNLGHPFCAISAVQNMMDVTFEFIDGPLDGLVVSDPHGVRQLYIHSGRGRMGNRFWWYDTDETATMAREEDDRPDKRDNPPAYYYEVVQRVEQDNRLLIRAGCVATGLEQPLM